MGNAITTAAAKGYGPYEYALGDELRGERATLGKTLLDVQRDLRIKAAYIGGIEDADVGAFPNPSFVSGYIRSYARYLGLDPEEVYHRFCQESGFSSAKASPPRAVGLPHGGQKAAARAAGLTPNFPLADVRGGLPLVPVSAIGSVLLLAALVVGLGYGAWTVIQNIQRVQFAPVDDLPLAVAEHAPLETPEVVPPGGEWALTELAAPVAATALTELYRQQEAEVPILVPRDGPIAAIDPDAIGPLAGQGPSAPAKAAAAAVVPLTGPGAHEPIFASLPASAGDVAAPAADEAGPLPLVVMTDKAAWVRVYLDNGTIIFERILETGESYALPEGVSKPLIWAGNSGSVYVRVGDALHGPLGPGTRAVKDVVLEPAAISERFAVVEDIPAELAQSVGLAPQQSAPAVEIR